MKPTISEFSYGFALTNEICNELSSLGFSGAPLLPNLRQEGKLGYDAKIPLKGFPIFIQFKLSDFMSNRRAKEWNEYNSPYFRVHLHNRRHSNQHNLLQKLAQEGNYVCYVSPLFTKYTELNNAFLSKEVTKRSIFIEASRLPQLPDDKNHYLTFLKGNDLMFCSEPLHLEGKFTNDNFMNSLTSIFKFSDSLHTMDSEYFKKLRAKIIKIIGLINFPLEKEKNDPIGDIIDIIYLCRVFFGCEILLISKPEIEIK